MLYTHLLCSVVHYNVQENKSLLCKASGFCTYCATLVSSVTIFSIRLFLKSHIKRMIGMGYSVWGGVGTVSYLKMV